MNWFHEIQADETKDSLDGVELVTFKPVNRISTRWFPIYLQPTTFKTKEIRFVVVVVVKFTCSTFRSFHLLFGCEICLFSYNEQTNNFRQKSARNNNFASTTNTFVNNFSSSFRRWRLLLMLFHSSGDGGLVMVVDSFFTSFGLIEYFGKLPYVLCTEMRILWGIAKYCLHTYAKCWHGIHRNWSVERWEFVLLNVSMDGAVSLDKPNKQQLDMLVYWKIRLILWQFTDAIKFDEKYT